jgi:2-amino-4-hydroxy-6-hydroxymethyldihydropteridine diphosphokinase
MKNNRAFIGLGSNLGNREENLYNGLRLMHYFPDINVVGTSAIYETEPVGVIGHPDYLNMTAEILTTRDPFQLLEALQSVEDELGRSDRGQLKPRVLDLDILLFGDQVIDTESLVIPHPRLTERKYALQTLLDIDKNIVNPRTGLTIQHHFDQCENRSKHQLFRE